MRYAYRYDPYASVERHLHWTDGTVLTIVPGVPEAPAWGMLVAGLVGVWAAGRFGGHGVPTMFNAARAA